MLEILKEEMELWKLGYGFWEYFVDYMHKHNFNLRLYVLYKNLSTLKQGQSPKGSTPKQLMNKQQTMNN
jgi:hypothetical protein